MKFLQQKSRTGFTLVEMMVTVASSSFILAAIIAAGMGLIRSFAAVEGYSITEGDQLRVSDYIALDARRARSADVATDANGVLQLTFTVPNYYTANGSPETPQFDSNGAIQYGGATSTIKYYRQGTSFIREVNGTATAIATSLTSFNVTEEDVTASMKCTIRFPPRFRYLQSDDAAIEGTMVYSNTFLRNPSARK